MGDESEGGDCDEVICAGYEVNQRTVNRMRLTE